MEESIKEESIKEESIQEEVVVSKVEGTEGEKLVMVVGW